MTSRKIPRNTQKNWGIYTFIAGDNNLSDAGLADIEEMTKAGASKDVHVAIQIDTAGDHTGSIRYEISEPDFQGNSHRVVIQRLPEQNTGAPRYLAEFASWAAQRYPAKNRLLVVWNHGAGFMHTPTRDIGYDDSSEGDALTMAELRWALETTGFGDKVLGRLAILGFDACLMSMLEVAYEFTGLTDVIVGSQQVEPGNGWPYDEVVRLAKSKQSVKQLADGIVKTYIDFYKQEGTIGVTQSAIDMSKLPAVCQAIDQLGSLLLKQIPDHRGKILEARIPTQGYDEPTYVDATDLVSNISSKFNDAQVSSACTNVGNAIKTAVISNGTYGGSVSRSSGLSIWFPLLRMDYISRRSEYVALRYASQYPNWVRFLDAMIQE